MRCTKCVLLFCHFCTPLGIQFRAQRYQFFSIVEIELDFPAEGRLGNSKPCRLHGPSHFELLWISEAIKYGRMRKLDTTEEFQKGFPGGVRWQPCRTVGNQVNRPGAAPMAAARPNTPAWCGASRLECPGKRSSSGRVPSGACGSEWRTRGS